MSNSKLREIVAFNFTYDSKAMGLYVLEKNSK